jgi:hypothetical protein
VFLGAKVLIRLGLTLISISNRAETITASRPSVNHSIMRFTGLEGMKKKGFSDLSCYAFFFIQPNEIDSFKLSISLVLTSSASAVKLCIDREAERP